MGGILDMASAGGHHIAGTPYQYHHGWVLVGGVDEAKPGTVMNHPKFGRGIVRGSTGVLPVRKQGHMVSDGKPQRVMIDFPNRVKAQFDVKSAHGHPDVPFGIHPRSSLPAGMIQTSNQYKGVIDMAQRMCPNCGYASDDADFSVSGGSAGTSDPGKGAALQTPQPHLPKGSGGTPLTVRGAGSPSMGLANGGRAIGLANRLPVRQPVDLLVSRSPSGSQIVRHRRGGGSIGELKHNDDGTWQSVVDGRDLTPHRQQRAALMEMVGMYNKTAGTPERAAQPLMPAPEQTPLMEQFGVPAIRLAADDSDSSDDTDTSGNGLTPRGQGIYKKLCGKGVSPKVAMAMAKRAQNTSAGSFGQKAS